MSRMLLKLLVLSAFMALGSDSTDASPLSTWSNNGCEEKMAEINTLTTETLASFKESKFDRAYSSAKKASELADRFCPQEDEKRLALKMNLAEIQLKRKNFSEARLIFDTNLPLAEIVYKNNLANLNSFLNYLIKLSVGEIAEQKFETYFLKSLVVKESHFGNESKEFVAELVKVARHYAFQKQLEKADEYFLRAVKINHDLVLQKKTTDSSPMNHYRSFLVRNFGDEGRIQSDEIALRWSVAASGNDENRIMNGKAIKIFEPVYPRIAREAGASGEVLVSVEIDENGKVIEAKATSGHKMLYDAAVEAAKKWEFLPTFVEGSPKKVSGLIKFVFQDW